ncbi:MAG: sigma-E factor negative regulatory protein [Pseudomonadota bacterium]|nr:sigma-E factor negative regulatory protein [Pseudomonadota bacterium]
MMEKEQLSSLLDGELDELATVRLLRALDDDAEALTAWDEYAMIGEALREREGPSSAGVAGARRALAQIMAEPAPVPAVPRRAAEWRRAAPWAVAASAAVMAFVYGGSVAGPAVQMAQELAGGHATSLARQERPGLQIVGADPMERYIDYHRELVHTGFQQAAFVPTGDGSRQER